MLYPILTESRLLSDLSGVWDFKLDNGKGFDEKWYEAPLKDADTMPVPAFLQMNILNKLFRPDELLSEPLTRQLHL
jgi:beta-galactosidase/beta-glucuronidase